MLKTIYAIPAPYAPAMIEVYGDPDFACYEWRLVGQDGELLQDTESQAYGSAEIALRDALIACS